MLSFLMLFQVMLFYPTHLNLPFFVSEGEILLHFLKTFLSATWLPINQL